jgi:hypothetical protein
MTDEVAKDVVPVVFGSGKRSFAGIDAQHLLEDPDVVTQENRVLHLRFEVRRPSWLPRCVGAEGLEPPTTAL